MFRILSVAFITMLLVGCGQTKPDVPEVITVVKTKVVSVPNELIGKCSISKPPSIDEYMKLSHIEREVILGRYVNQLLVDFKICNNKFDNIKEWNDKQLQIFKQE